MIRTTAKIVFSPLLALILSSTAAAETRQLSVDDAVRHAQEHSRRGEISQLDVEFAEARYQQARSVYRPTVELIGHLHRRDDPISFTYPALNFAAQTPLGPLPVSTPEQKVEALGKTVGGAELTATLPLYTGGLRKSLVRQADLGRGLANEAVRRTSADIAYDVRRYYYGAQMARAQMAVVEETVLDLENIEMITDAFFSGGSDRVDRADVLQSRLSANMARTVRSELNGGYESAIVALTHGTGFQWNDRVEPMDTEFDMRAVPEDLETLVTEARRFNPEIASMRLAVEIADADINRAASGSKPKIALTGSIARLESDLDGGLTNSANRNSWTLGVALSVPLFNGGRTRNAVAAATAGHRKREVQHLELENGVAARLRALMIEAQRARDALELAGKSSDTAREFHDLMLRAYQAGARDLEDLLNAQFLKTMNAMTLIQARHDLAIAASGIERLVGKALDGV